MDIEISQAVLRSEQREAGFHIVEDEHFFYLYDREGRRQCIFSVYGATPLSIQNEVDTLMNN
jgi:hypothetical protein